MSGPGDAEREDDVARQMVAALTKAHERCVLPIFVRQDGQFRQHGTGTLFQVADRQFLVTAAHVLTIAARHRLSLFVADYDSGSQLEQLLGRHTFIREDRVDVAIVELAPHLAHRLAGRKFLRLADMDFRDHVREGLFFVLGYPSEWNRSQSVSGEVPSEYLAYLTHVYSGPLRSSSYDPRFHLLISACKSSAQAIDGTQRKLPRELSGISGSSIWKTHSERHPPSIWTPDVARIVAVETLAFGDRHEVIRGTHIAAVLRLLHDSYADLRSVLRLYLPEVPSLG